MVKNGQNLPQNRRPLKGNFQGLAVVEFQISGDFRKVQRTLFQQYLNESSSISLLQGEKSPPKNAPPQNHQNFKKNFFRFLASKGQKYDENNFPEEKNSKKSISKNFPLRRLFASILRQFSNIGFSADIAILTLNISGMEHSCGLKFLVWVVWVVDSRILYSIGSARACARMRARAKCAHT